MKTKLKWKMKGFGKGVNVELVDKELNKINETYDGALTPENIVAEASKKNSILHTFFEWDNTKAAAQYRLQQARNLINNIEVIVISNGERRDVGAYEVISHGANRSYKSIEVMTQEDINQVRQNAIADLEHLRNKISFYNQFKPVMPHLNRAVKSLKTVVISKKSVAKKTKTVKKKPAGKKKG
jgi:hypothetical protein